jgi:hypothetical protein
MLDRVRNVVERPQDISHRGSLDKLLVIERPIDDATKQQHARLKEKIDGELKKIGKKPLLSPGKLQERPQDTPHDRLLEKPYEILQEMPLERLQERLQER